MDNPEIVELFLKNIEDLKPNKYKWYKIKNIFVNICKNIINNFNEKNDLNIFIKNYYSYLILFTYYTNFCYYYKLDIDEELIQIDKNIRCDTNIIKTLLLNMNDWRIKNIFKYILPYIVLKKKIKRKDIENTSNFIKHCDNIYNNEYKNSFNKTLDVIIFKYVICKNNNYKNYHDFYTKIILNDKLPNNFTNFTNYLEEDTEIFNMTVPTNNNSVINNIDISEIINYLLITQKSIKFTKISNNLYKLSSSKNIIEIHVDIEKPLGIVCIKKDLNMIYYNIKELEELKYLQHTKNHIIIYINSNNIDNLSTLLTIIHLITISLKTLNSEPIDAYELNNPIEYHNYYFDSFVNFLKYIKNDINKNLVYNKFLTELFKFYYLYSVYDYYIYFKNDLLESIVENDKKKDKIFNDVCLEIKNMCNLPANILHYPPFVNNKIDDINYIMNYSYEQPNYFKLFDFINAIIQVFEVKKYNNDFEDIFCKCINVNKENNNSKINNNLQKINNEKAVIHKINKDTYEELSIIQSF